MIKTEKYKELNEKVEVQSLKVKNRVVEINTQDIDENDLNFYNVSKESVDELAESISVNGLLQPITVYKNDNNYKIISGHTRFNAFLKLKKEKIPAIIESNITDENELLFIIENNRQRIKTKKERDKEIKILLKEYKKLKDSKIPGYINININKLVSEKLGISVSTVKRASTTKVKDEDNLNSKKSKKILTSIDNIINSGMKLEETLIKNLLELKQTIEKEQQE